MEEIKLFSMFSGYGGAEFALKQANIPFNVIGFSEIDKYAIQCYKQNHGNVKNFGDCAKINPNDIPDFDLLTGGFPCQAFSIAGKQLGEMDTRGTLFYEIIRIAEVKKPKWLVLENVRGLLADKFKDTFNKILSELDRIGYYVKWKVLNTKDYDVPQNRERIIFVCYRKDLSFDFDWPEKEDLKLFLKDILEEEVDEKYYLKQEQVEKLLSSTFNQEKTRIQEGNISQTLCARDWKSPKCVSDKMVLPCLTPDRIEKRQNGRRIKDENESMFTLTSQDRHGIVIGDYRYDEGFRPRKDGVCPTLTRNVRDNNNTPSSTPIIIQKVGDRDKDNFSIKTDYSNCLNANPMSDRQQLLIKNTTNKNVIHNCLTQAIGRSGNSDEFKSSINKVYLSSMQIRRLTPRECFRLQGFLNDEINLDGISNSQLYKLAGNGWSINVFSKVFQEMFIYKKKSKSLLDF